MSVKRSTLALLAALLLIGAAFATTGGLAQEEDDEEEEANESEEADEDEEEEAEDDEEDEEDEREEEREVKLETEGKDVTISLERKTEPREDEVEMKWQAEEASFELEHKSENETREIENKLEATFGALAEYRDGNDNGRYDAGEEIVSGWVLSDELEDEEEIAAGERAEWGSPAISDVTREGKDGKRITSTAQLGEAGELTLRFLVFGDFVDMNGTSLSPTGAKIDIVVTDYAYQDNETALALFLETESENEYESDVDEDDDETGVAVANRTGEEEVRLVFTWKDTAQVDGDSQAVETTVLSEETESESDDEEASTEIERRFALSYPRGEEIVHDPKAEVQMGSAAGADVPAPGPLALLAVGASLALATARRRG